MSVVIRRGEPIIDGSDITVAKILELLGYGHTIEDICNSQGLWYEEVTDALFYASDNIYKITLNR